MYLLSVPVRLLHVQDAVVEQGSTVAPALSASIKDPELEVRCKALQVSKLVCLLINERCTPRYILWTAMKFADIPQIFLDRFSQGLAPPIVRLTYIEQCFPPTLL